MLSTISLICVLKDVYKRQGHMGREPQVVTKKFSSRYEGDKTVELELFTWEKLDYVDKIKAAFGGYDQVMDAYHGALKEGYRFGTYGDARLILDK